MKRAVLLHFLPVSRCSSARKKWRVETPTNPEWAKKGGGGDGHWPFGLGWRRRRRKERAHLAASHNSKLECGLISGQPPGQLDMSTSHCKNILIQGDHSGRAIPPVNIETKVVF